MFAKKLPFSLDCRLSNYSLLVLGVAFAALFYVIPEAPASCEKKFWNIFCCFVPRMSAKTVSQIFKILFQNADINNFVLCGVKSSFSDEKNSSEIWETL